MLQQRGAPFSTAARQAAFVLDPRNIFLVNDPEADQKCGFNFGQARQEALSSTFNHYIPKFWTTEAALGSCWRNFPAPALGLGAMAFGGCPVSWSRL